MTRRNFDSELLSLHNDLMNMANLIQKSIMDAVKALSEKDVELAKKVYDSDDIIDELEHKIERKCINLIARQQPLASDLRTISTALKIITDMERIADHAADICELTIKMSHESYFELLEEIPEMANVAKNMVNKAIESFIKQDVELAREVCKEDDVVDDYFVKIVDELRDKIRQNPDTVYQATNYILVVKYIERIGDHATNIGEWVNYNVTGIHENM